MTEAYETLELRVSQGLARLTLDDPDHGNAVTPAFCRDFAHAVDRLTNDDSVRAVLLDARGRYFSVGGDVRMFAHHEHGMPAAVRSGTFGLHTAIARLARIDAPVIAAVHGAAMGGAVGLIANTDLVVAGRSATFGAAYAKIGFSLDMGASFALASRMGLARARRFLLLGEVLDAASAERVGLVDELVDDSDVADTALDIATRLAAGPTRAYGEVRRLLQRVFSTPFESQLEDEAAAFARVVGTEDAREGVTAFLEKRRPEFRGR